MEGSLRQFSEQLRIPPSNPSLQPTYYGSLRQPPQAAELKR